MMSSFEWAQLIAFIFLVLCLVPLLGGYMKKVFQAESTFLHPLLRPIEKMSYRITGINPNEEMHWRTYLKSLLIFNLLGFFVLFLLLCTQKFLPFNPEHFKSIRWPLAFNIAMSFVTNTNWQSYAGEVTLSYFTQMAGLTVQNFLSAATGIAVLLVLIRGICQKSKETLGNFWVDIIRCIVYLFLPLSCLLAFALISLGVVQTLSPYAHITTLENNSQTIPLGPVASQVAIKQLGTNGGGFFNTNSAHPFENPSSLSNFLELLAIILIPASLTFMYGSMAGSQKHGWMLFLAMLLIWCGGSALALYSEFLNNPLFNASPLLEGKETRIGVLQSILWATTTTATANGSINGMISSLSPLAGGVAMFNIMLGELVFGGVGVGLCTMLMFVFLTIFIAGLMVGRTPEYLGKKIEKKEVQWMSVAILVPCAMILIGSSFSLNLPLALKSIENRGPHGLSEILYAFSSASGNNGSAFAGLHVNTNFYNLILGIVMMGGRLSIIIPSIAIAGQLAKKKSVPPSSQIFSTETFFFLVLLLGVILLVGALAFFPAVILGPIVEHFLMLKGQSF